MQLVDIGVNLGHHRFDKDRAAVVDRARACGVDTMILTGTSLAESARALELAEAFDQVATVGVHPHEAQGVDDGTLASLEILAAHPRCVAIGECGLDFHRDLSPRPVQERIFTAQLHLAARVGKPVFLHQRAAWERFAHLLRPLRPRIPGAVVHCFTEGPAEAAAAVELGCHIGVTGWVCDERRAGPLRAALPHIPLDRLMLETDAPFLSPRDLPADSPVPGLSRARIRKRNEPAVLPWICRAVAATLPLSGEDLAVVTTANARRFFRLDRLRDPA